MSNKYPDGKEFIAHYEKVSFPALKSFGDYVPIPFAVWPKGGAAGPGAKAKIILAVSKAGGQVAKKEAEVVLAAGAPFCHTSGGKRGFQRSGDQGRLF